LGLANGSNLWMYWFSEFLGAGVAAVFFLVLNREKLHEPSVVPGGGGAGADDAHSAPAASSTSTSSSSTASS
jgi:hypothetical protein